jgi:hypothetical protein
MSALDDFMNKLQLFWATFQYSLIQQIAQALWSVERGFFMMGHVIMLVNQWLSSQAFNPLIQLSSDTLKVATSWVFVVALLILGITYMLAVFVRVDIVVPPRTALLWFLAGTFFFQAGPAIYQGFNDLRKTVSGAFYLSALNAIQSDSNSAFGSLSNVRTSDLGMLDPCDNFGPFLPGSTGSSSSFSGLDVALAYLRADGIDIIGAPYPVRDNCQAHPPMGSQWALPLPWEWTRPNSFFGNTTSSLMFPTMTQQQRDDSINLAGTSIWRLFSS